MACYLLIIEGGTEISKDGPYDDDAERLSAARLIWRDLSSHKGDNLFRLDVGVGTFGEHEVSTTVFLEGELD